MPQLTKEQFDELIKSLEETAIPLSINLSREQEEKAKVECENYLNDRSVNVNDISPLGIYCILSKLPSNEQIEFLRKNINYIKEHDEDIFLYTLMSPSSLSYYFSLEVLKELRLIDKDILKKVISQNYENLFHGFKHEDYLEFYKEFYDELQYIKNWEFVNSIYFHNRCCYDKNSGCDINSAYETQRIFNKEFMDFLLKNYKEKINSLEKRELLYFIKHIEDLDDYKTFISENFDKINNALKDIHEYDLEEYLSDCDSEKQEILIENFFDNIINLNNVKKIIFRINPRIVLNIYSKNKALFKNVDLNDWIKLSSKNKILSSAKSFNSSGIKRLR